ncbi:MAG: YceI family protein [Actinomycetota bacterium]|nr:YceI family protein [Actinomycetota bacterium]
MSMEPGTYALGPQNGTLSVRTGRRGAAAKAGHDLLIEVEDWSATVQIGGEAQQTVLELTADSGSLRVREGTGGVQSLGEDDRSGIDQTIVKDVLKGTTIAFRSRSVQSGGERRLSVEGDLELRGTSNPVSFDLSLGDDGDVSASAVVKQTAWGIKPHSALFGTLKVADEVQVVIDGRLSAQSR